MIDDEAQLDLIDAVVAPGRRAVLRVCLDLDASWRPMGGRVHIGVRRSPLHSPEAVGRLARAIAGRPGFRLVGLMSYEAQIAGLGDAPAGPPDVRPDPALGAAPFVSRTCSTAAAAAVAAAAEHAELEFVNGGGTGSLAAHRRPTQR